MYGTKVPQPSQNECSNEELGTCPRCQNLLQNFKINFNDSQILCPNTTCSFPFLIEDNLEDARKNKENSVAEGKQSSLEIPEIAPESVIRNLSEDAFDIQAFFDQSIDPAINDIDTDFTDIFDVSFLKDTEYATFNTKSDELSLG